MARQERNNVDYFPHPVVNGKSMFYLRTKYKNDGYTSWYIILEKLGKADFHFLDLKDEVQRMYLSAEIGITIDVLNAIISDLVKMEHFDRDLWEQEMIIFDQEFVDSISDAYKKRNNEIVKRDTLIEFLGAKGRLNGPLGRKKPPKGSLKGSGNTQRIGEDRIEKKSKEEDAREFYKSEFEKAKESGDGKAAAGYFRFVGIIWNEGEYENAISRPAEHILKLPSQITFKQYSILSRESKKRGVNLADLLDVMINDPKYTKGKNSIYLTLLNWVKREEIKGTNHV